MRIALVRDGLLQAYHALGADKTHTNRAAALAIASFAATAMKSQNLGIASYLRP